VLGCYWVDGALFWHCAFSFVCLISLSGLPLLLGSNTEAGSC
jgi:hypothetical protein